MSNDDQQFKKLLADLRPNLLRLAHRLCECDADAQDLVQNTITRATERSHRFKPGTDLGAWCATILRNRFYDDCRHPSRRNVPIDPETEAIPEPEDRPEKDHTLEEIYAALDRLDARRRTVFLLAEVENKPHAEIGRILGCAPGGVGRLLWEARDKLRKLLKP